MQTILKLYFYDPRCCACQERELLIRYDSERVVPSLNESLWGRIKHAWKARRKP